MLTNQLFEQLVRGQDLSPIQMQTVMHGCMSGDLSDTQLAIFLALMRMKGETVDELTSATNVLKQFSCNIDLGSNLIDIVGTGGDGKQTFNISTISSIIAASAGARVAKHGNHGVSSRSGSADLFSQAGIALLQQESQLQECIKQHNICFLYAPYFHPAMQHARRARQAFGIRSFFNLLGPLINPSHVKKQVVGVCEQRLQSLVAQVLVNTGSERVLVVCGRDGMDEISITAITDVLEYRHGQFYNWSINPSDYHCYHASIDTITVNSPAESLTIIEAILAGHPGAARDIVLLNTSVALLCAGLADTIATGITLAAKSIDTGAADFLFNALKQHNHFKKLSDN